MKLRRPMTGFHNLVELSDIAAIKIGFLPRTYPAFPRCTSPT
jgi:hypothetical protein